MNSRQQDLLQITAWNAALWSFFVITAIVWTGLEFMLGIERAILPAYIVGSFFGIVVYIRIYLEKTNER